MLIICTERPRQENTPQVVTEIVDNISIKMAVYSTVSLLLSFKIP